MVLKRNTLVGKNNFKFLFLICLVFISLIFSANSKNNLEGTYTDIKILDKVSSKNTLLKLFSQKPIMRWENNKNLPPNEYRGHVKEFFEDELITLVQKHNFKLLASRPIVPRPSLKGNIPFIIYRLFEYFFYILTKPFVNRGYSNNHNMIFEKN